MAEPTNLIVIGADGTIRALGKGAEQRLKASSGRYQLVLEIPGLIVLRREAPARAGAQPTGPRVLMAGEIVNRTTVLELVNMIASANWRGDLRIFAPDSTRMLAFDQGVVKHASSDHMDDRLGEVLYRMGVLSRVQLETLLREVGPERRFGQLLVDRGLVDREHLFQYLQKQVEQVFFAALLVREGTYVFGSPDESATPPGTTVHMPAQHLLMEGVQRIDEMALFRERIPHGRLCPEVQPGAPTPKQMDQNAQLVLAYSDGTRTIADIARETGLGEFLTTKAVYYLLQQGQVLLRSEARADEATVLALVGQFNSVLRDIFVAVATYGGLDQTRQTVAAWIEGSGYAPYFGPTVEEDGSIDARTVLGGLRRARLERPLEALHQSLHELSAFALFAATSSLPRDQEMILARDVNRRLKAIRI